MRHPRTLTRRRGAGWCLGMCWRAGGWAELDGGVVYLLLRTLPMCATMLTSHASVAELADAPDSKFGSARSVGSIPTRGTSQRPCSSTDRVEVSEASGPGSIPGRGTKSAVMSEGFSWGLSSVGRASRSQREGRRFDPGSLHQRFSRCPGGGIGRHTILRGWWRKPCGFESRPGHQPTDRPDRER